MSFCMGCGKQIENADYCPDCAAKMQNTAPAADAAAAQTAPPVQVKAAKKRNINGKIIALLSLLGVFTAMTVVVGVLFN